MNENETAAAFAIALEQQWPKYLWSVAPPVADEKPRLLHVVMQGDGYTVSKGVPVSLLKGVSLTNVAWVVGAEIFEWLLKGSKHD